jgi:hypothetical protein
MEIALRIREGAISKEEVEMRSEMMACEIVGQRIPHWSVAEKMCIWTVAIYFRDTMAAADP